MYDIFKSVRKFAVLGCLGLLAVPSNEAREFESMGGKLTGTLDTTLTVGLGMRLNNISWAM